MDFYAVLDQAVDLLRQRGRVTYRALKLQFQLDNDQLEALKDELLYAHPQVVDDAGRGLLWTNTPEAAAPPAAAPAPTQDRAPLTYTPPHLAEQILTSRAALEGERKQVTVLFADLKGSMELLAERDPEEARHLLDPVLDHMMAAVHQYEGTVNQVMGDGIMALFGAPLAHKDHAVRACYAALRMQEAVKQYAAQVQRTHGVPIHMRVGLNAGEVVVRSIGSDLHMDYTAVGQTTHLAARMEQMAMPGAILTTPAVLGLVEGFVQVKALGTMPVRGLRDPVEVYEVTGAGVVRSRLQAAAARGLTRFVGRQPEEEKRVLQTAAVIGTEVPFTLLQAIAELPEADLYRGLAHLQAAEFLYETRLFPERDFTFKHALTHEVAYNGLLQERRRVLHARIVEALEALSQDRLAEQVDRLAHHALRGEVWDKALTYCHQAGGRAMAGSAHREAVVYFEQALEALAQLPESRDTLEQAIDLRCDLRNALLPLGEQGRMVDHLRAAEALAERLGDDQRRGRVAGHLCISFLAMDEYDRAIAAGQQALALATASGALDILVPAQTALALMYLHVGGFREALDVARRAVALLTGDLRYARFGRLALPGVTSRVYVTVCLAELGDMTAGRNVGEEAVRLAEEVEHPYSIAVALWHVGMLCLRQRNVHTAIPMLERGLALCQSANIPLFVPLFTTSLGAAYALTGRATEALPLLDQTLKRVTTGSRTLLHALLLTELSEALLLVSREEDASALASRLLDLSRTHTRRGYQAHTALSAAIDLYRAMDMTFWLPQAEAALAQVDGSC